MCEHCMILGPNTFLEESCDRVPEAKDGGVYVKPSIFDNCEV